MRRRPFPLAAAFLLTVAITQAEAQPCDSSPLLIRNVNVWTSGGVRPGHDVLFREGRIASITRSSGRGRDGTRTIDGTGHTLLPGLIDSHLHFSIPGGLPSPRATGADALDIVGRQLLRSGVTSGRVHLASLDVAAALKARSADACEPVPRVQFGGPAFGGAASADSPAFWSVKTAAEAAEKVERLRAAGMQWVAIHDAHRFPAGVLDAIVAAARKAGVRVMGAGTVAQEIDAIVRVNPDTLDYFDRPGQDYTPERLEMIRQRRHLILVPTPGIFHRVGAYLENPRLLEHPHNFEFFQDGDRAHVLAAAKAHLAGADGTRAKETISSLPRKLAQLRGLSLPLALGSDTGSNLHFQGGGIWWELEGWRSFGFTHREALVAATGNGARVLADKDAGRLAAGHRADFVLYRGDVERAPFDMTRVIAIGKGGVLHVSDGKWTER